MQRLDADCEENRDPGSGKINKDPSAIDNGEAIRERLPFGKNYFDVDAGWSGAVMCPAC